MDYSRDSVERWAEDHDELEYLRLEQKMDEAGEEPAAEDDGDGREPDGVRYLGSGLYGSTDR